MAFVLSQEPYNYDTRSCGTDSFHALIPLSSDLLWWAEEIVCADKEHVERIKEALSKSGANSNTPIHCLNIPDNYYAYDPKLIELIRERYERVR
jgi:predicted protein tyrosine phosphatase